MTSAPDKLPFADVLPHPAPIAPGPHPLNHVFDKVMTAVFMAVLIVPLLGTYFHWDPSPRPNENRALEELPETPHSFKAVTHYSDGFLAFFKDHFGFRNTLISNFQKARLRTGLLTDDDSVIVGKGGWLFFSERPTQTYLRERGFEPFTEKELDQWQDFLEKRTAYLGARGIPYIAIFAPDKQSIYPEYLPEGLVEKPPTRLDQLIERLKERHSPVRLVDMRAAMIAAKGPRLLYRKTDTHWNDFGARIGYLEIMAAVQKALPQFEMEPQSFSDFFVKDRGPFHGDLSSMLGLDTELTEDWFDVGRRVQYTDNPATRDAPANPKLPRLLMMRDSFSNLLIQLIGPHFDHPVFVKGFGLDVNLVARIKPNLVMSEMVERTLYAKKFQADGAEIENFKASASPRR